METEIFPYFVPRAEYFKILFVGCAWYTRGYQSLFRGKDYQTLEIDPRERRCGAKKHITDSLENISRHYDEGELDLIICNGVFGWGLDEKTAVEAAFDGCFRCLRPGGVLVQGWNDTPERCPFPLADCESLKQFEPFVFPPLGAAEYRLAMVSRHVYSFYVKPS